LKGNIFDLAPLLPAWEKGLGDEGDSCKRSIEWIARIETFEVLATSKV
jgi:hypothetical protein